MRPSTTVDSHDPNRSFPWVNVGLLAASFLVFFYELALAAQGGGLLDNLLNGYAVVPCEYTNHCAVYAGAPHPFWIALLTSMFLHGAWAHLLGNMLFLYGFVNGIQRSIAHGR